MTRNLRLSGKRIFRPSDYFSVEKFLAEMSRMGVKVELGPDFEKRCRSIVEINLPREPLRYVVLEKTMSWEEAVNLLGQGWAKPVSLRAVLRSAKAPFLAKSPDVFFRVKSGDFDGVVFFSVGQNEFFIDAGEGSYQNRGTQFGILEG